MSTTTSLFDQAQLAEAAYADLWNDVTQSAVTDPDIVKDRLVARKPDGSYSFSTDQASEFILHWKVVDHIPDTDNIGFSATVFESLDRPGEFNLAIRGSTTDQVGLDFLVDANLIISDGVAARVGRTRLQCAA